MEWLQVQGWELLSKGCIGHDLSAIKQVADACQPVPRPKHGSLFAKICAALWIPHGMPKDALLADLGAGELASASLPYVLDLGRGLAVVSSECSGCRPAPSASLRHVGRLPPKGEIEREVAPRFHRKLLHLRGCSVKGHALKSASRER